MQGVPHILSAIWAVHCIFLLSCISIRVLNVMIRRSIVRRDLRAAVRTDERPLVTYPTLADAGQHPARSDDVFRYDADRSHPEPFLTRHGDRGRRAAVHDSIMAVNLLQRCRHCRHHQLLDADIPFRHRSTSYHLLPDTGESTVSLLCFVSEFLKLV